MKPVSTLYRRLLANPQHTRQTKVTVAGMEYGSEKLFSCSVSSNLLPDAVIGNCISHEISVTLMPDAVAPKMAEIRVYFRLVLDTEVSEWLPSGVFFVDTRSEAERLLTLHGFDAMLKSEAVWLDPSVDAGEWPMSQVSAVADIAQRIGIGLDPRSQLQYSYWVDYPNDLTMREVLGGIAAAHGGNWSITGEGKLLFTPLGGLPPETRFLVDDADGDTILFGSVRILV